MNTRADQMEQGIEPLRLNVEEITTYDIDDVDGKMFMLDHSFSGCLTVSATRRLDERIPGKVFYGEKEISTCVVKCVVSAGGSQHVGIPVRSILRDYDTDYVIRVEGLTDMDGNVMASQEIPLMQLTTQWHLPLQRREWFF